MKNPEPLCLKGVCETGTYLFCYYHTLIASRVPGGKGSREKVVFSRVGVLNIVLHFYMWDSAQYRAQDATWLGESKVQIPGPFPQHSLRLVGPVSVKV